MHEVSTRFLAAMAESFASASCSATGAGSVSGTRSRIVCGTIASTIWARVANPSAASIARWSSALVPMWRATKASRRSRSASDSRDGVDGDMLLVTDYRLIAASVEHRVHRGRIGRADAEQPRDVGVLVDGL